MLGNSFDKKKNAFKACDYCVHVNTGIAYKVPLKKTRVCQRMIKQGN